jgi:hypothetical protein
MDIFRPLAGCNSVEIASMLVQDYDEDTELFDIVEISGQLCVHVETASMAAYVWQDGLGESLFVRSINGYTIRALRDLSVGFDRGTVICPMIDFRNFDLGGSSETLFIKANTDGSIVHLMSWDGSAFVDTHFRPNGDCDLAGVFKPLGGYKSSDGSSGVTQTLNLLKAGGGSNLLVVKDGIIVSVT